MFTNPLKIKYWNRG